MHRTAEAVSFGLGVHRSPVRRRIFEWLITPVSWYSFCQPQKDQPTWCCFNDTTGVQTQDPKIFHQPPKSLSQHQAYSSTKLCHNPSHNFFSDIVLYIVVGPISQWWRIISKIIRSRFVSSPKSNQFVLVTHPTFPPNIVWIRHNSLRYPDSETDIQGWKSLSSLGGGGNESSSLLVIFNG